MEKQFLTKTIVVNGQQPNIVNLADQSDQMYETIVLFITTACDMFIVLYNYVQLFSMYMQIQLLTI